jgi:iron complex transport system permease protein
VTAVVDRGRPTLLVRRRRLSLLADVRTIVVCVLLAAAAVAISLVSLGTGEIVVPVPDVVSALLGKGSSRTELVVVQWRLPRVLLALIIGAVLAVSGAIFQTLTDNPLGSPDIIGFTTGSYTGALVVILLLHGSSAAVAGGALIGGLVTAAVVYLLAYRGGMRGFRLIIVGIAITAMLGSVNTYLSIKAKFEMAMLAALWGAGSLGGLGWDTALPMLAGSAVLLAMLAPLAGRLRMLELGDDAARALGVRTERLRIELLLLGVALVAVATATAGPIAFVALVAPQLARRLTRGPGVQLVPSALMGAVLLVASDLVAQRAFAPLQLPVGVVTVSLGGIYLVWLLAREARRR